MATNVTVAGSTFSVPNEGDSGWANDVTNLLIQLATSSKVLQVTSSTFSLQQDLSFGNTYGLKLNYIKSQTTNPAGTGIIRLGNNENISWRNYSNTADISLKVNSDDKLEYNSDEVVLQATLSSHTDDDTIHLNETSVAAIDHTVITNIGSNSHSQIDSFITKLDIIQAEGDLIVGDSEGAPSVLSAGTVGNLLTIDGSGVPAWAAPGSVSGTSPVGSIIPWVGGYFGNGSNGSFSNVLGNTVSAVNSLLNSSGWYVCDGSTIDDAASPIFNGSSRYLPNLTDDRFLQGSTSAGGIGGSNTMVDHTHTFSLSMAHTHTINHDHASATTSNDSHNHTWQVPTLTSGGSMIAFNLSSSTASGNMVTSSSNVGSDTHSHTLDLPAFSGTSGAASTSTVSGSVGTGSEATSTENRPKYLSVFYIMRVK